MAASQSQTATAIVADPGVDNFAVSSASGVGNLDPTNDFAGATGGTDAFSETPNARTVDEVEQDGHKTTMGAYLSCFNWRLAIEWVLHRFPDGLVPGPGRRCCAAPR